SWRNENTTKTLAGLATLAALESDFSTSAAGAFDVEIGTCTPAKVQGADIGKPDLGPAKVAKPAKVGPFDPANGRADWTAEDWRARFDERAGFLEHDCGLSRVEAEAKAFEHCIIEWLNASPSPSSAGRCTWCGEAETPSAMVLPYRAGDHHAWVHAECW